MAIMVVLQFPPILSSSILVSLLSLQPRTGLVSTVSSRTIAEVRAD